MGIMRQVQEMEKINGLAELRGVHDNESSRSDGHNNEMKDNITGLAELRGGHDTGSNRTKE